MANLKYHEPVLLKEVSLGLNLAPLKRYIDATLGNGGHSLPILESRGQVLGIELDPEMLILAEIRLKGFDKKKLIRGNFRDIKNISLANGFDQVDGVVFDLGISNLHFESDSRGFSFNNPNAQLDMRIDQGIGPKANDLVNVLRPDQLLIMYEPVMGYLAAKSLVKNIVAIRKIKQIKTVGDYLECIPANLKLRAGKINPATLAFLALRIAVNSELDNLNIALADAFSLLKSGGRLLVISFNSLEDRLVKNRYKEFADEKKGIIVNKELIQPDKDEIYINLKSRSARLRIIEKI